MFTAKISVDYQHPKDIKTYAVPDAFYTYLSMRKIDRIVNSASDISQCGQFSAYTLFKVLKNAILIRENEIKCVYLCSLSPQAPCDDFRSDPSFRLGIC